MKDKNDNDLLDFLIDPGSIIRTDKHGFFTGYDLPHYYNTYDYDTDDTVIKIKDAKDFNKFAERVINGERNLWAVLSADIDFKNDPIVPVGTAQNTFEGRFDGRGHRLSGINLVNTNMPEETGLGIFSFVSNGVIQNFTVDESCTVTSNRATGVIGWVNKPYGEEHNYGCVKICGVINEGTCISTGPNASGMVGGVMSDRNLELHIVDCAVTGKVEGDRESAVFCAWFGSNQYLRPELSGCWTSTTITKGATYNESMYRSLPGCPVEVKNCYGYGPQVDPMPDDYKIEDFAKKLSNSWTLDKGELLVSTRPYEILVEKEKNQKQGNIATFFYPRDPYSVDGIHLGLPDEYVIAADFSQKTSTENNVDLDQRKFIEPILAFRHLFIIKDGKKFAEEFSGSVEKNLEYTRTHQRRIAARANHEFQVRLLSAVPKVDKDNDHVVRTKYYYKIDNTDYRRVCSVGIHVYDYNTGEEIKYEDGDPRAFHFVEEDAFKGQGSRTVDGITYNMCGGGGEYYRFIKCTDPQEGQYILRLIAKDYNGNEIKPFGATGDEKLIMQEFHIEILPEDAAFMVPSKTLDHEQKYVNYRDDKIEEIYGKPHIKIDFDEFMGYVDKEQKHSTDYMLYSHKDNNDHWQFKWPIPWSECQYGFGYDGYYDYNMYRLATHSSMTPYHSLADEHSENNNFETKCGGIFDRRFYRTKGKDPGFFFYVNTATDPGVMARLRVDKLCPGGTLVVSAWVSEFSRIAPPDVTETANIAFNFVAYKNDGTKVQIHSFVSGYVPQNVADWFNIHYSFVPKLTDLNIPEHDIKYYELELVNNCKSSKGADYAIDDIRLFVIRPHITAKQITPLCKSESGVDVMISAPFDVLLQSLGRTEAKNASDGVPVNMYYTILNKAVYDSIMAKPNPNYEEAFKQSVLHYNYMDLKGADASKDQTFGKIQFNTFFNSEMHHEYADSWNERQQNVPMKSTQNEEKYINFLIRPNDVNMTSGKEYLIAIY